MRANTLEDVVPGLREARGRERLNRTLAFSEVPWTVLGRQVVVLTPRHRLELQAVGNAFTTGAEPTRADVFQFLWRLSPLFARRPVFLTRSWRAREATARAVSRATLPAAVGAVVEYLAAMLQDQPERSGDERDSANPPEDYVHWLAAGLNFYLKRYHGFTRQVYMDTPYLVLQQLHRAHLLEVKEHPNFVNESDRLIAAWHRQNTPARANN